VSGSFTNDVKETMPFISSEKPVLPGNVMTTNAEEMV